MPGLINAHDHLEFALFPRLGNPPYRNYVEWGDDIHNRFPEVIAKHRAVPKDVRLWWGGIRNLLCGVTTVCHHDRLWPVLFAPEFPVTVLVGPFVVSAFAIVLTLKEGYKLRQVAIHTRQEP